MILLWKSERLHWKRETLKQSGKKRNVKGAFTLGFRYSSIKSPNTKLVN
jgi:hypothetical protein